MSKEHPHAELLRAIADGKKIANASGERVTTHYALSLILQNCADRLTIAPEVIVVNGITVPAPYRGPMEYGKEYWVAGYAACWTWDDDSADRMFMARGLIHLDAEAAVAHGRAMAAASSQEGGVA